jgi:hypothetical protein
MNQLTEMYDQIAIALTGDPLLLLASAVATFDPYWSEFEEGYNDDEDNPLHIVLAVTRGAFPDIYAEAVERTRANAPYQELDRLICKAITAKGIPMDNLETMSWGIPLVSCGVDLEDPDFYAVHSAVLPALIPFGIDIPESETYSIDVPECIYAAGRAVAASLHEQDDAALKQVGWLYAWLFGCSGNSLCDLTIDELYELQPLSWSPDDIAFAVEMIEEADGIMSDAMTGLKHLTTSPDLLTVLERNIAHLYRELKKKGKLDDRIRLDWSRADSGADRTAVADTEFLQLRRDAA